MTVDALLEVNDSIVAYIHDSRTFWHAIVAMMTPVIFVTALFLFHVITPTFYAWALGGTAATIVVFMFANDVCDPDGTKRDRREALRRTGMGHVM